ncbi:MAG: hypothetical protein P8Z31_03955 [Gammaproteobacteria bacterium]
MKSLKYVIGKSMLAFTLAFANYANADGITLPAGYACADFSLTINITPGDHYVIKEWTDEYGNPVRMLTAGRGADLEFINEDTGATYATMGNGSVSYEAIYRSCHVYSRYVRDMGTSIGSRKDNGYLCCLV